MESTATLNVRPGLSARGVYLRAAELEDLELLHQWLERTDPQLRTLLPAPLKAGSVWQDNAKRRLADPDEQILVVARTGDDGVIGGICVRELNLLNRSAEIEIFAEPELKKLGEFTDGALALIGHLFRTYNLNSLYSQATAADTRTVAALEELGFSRDGALRHRHFYQGEFGDVYIYSLLRYEFEM